MRILLIVLAVALTGCAVDTVSPARVAERFHALITAGQDEAACGMLARKTADKLPRRGQSCADALRELRLGPGGVVVSVSVWGMRPRCGWPVTRSSCTATATGGGSGPRAASRCPTFPTTARWTTDARDVRPHHARDRGGSHVVLLRGVVEAVRWVKENSLALAFLIMFLLAVAGQAVAGTLEFNDQQRAEGPRRSRCSITWRPRRSR